MQQISYCTGRTTASVKSMWLQDCRVYRAVCYSQSRYRDCESGLLQGISTVDCIPVLLLLHFYFPKILLCFSERTLFQGGNPPSKQNKPSAGCLHMKGAKKLHIFINNINGFHISAFFRVFLCLCTFVYLIFYELIH